VKVQVEEATGLVRKLSVEIPADSVRKETDRQVADFRRRVALKGFRKGKAPVNMVKSLYADEIQAVVADELVKTSYPEAVRESALTVASPPTVTQLAFTDDGGMAYTAEVEVFPEIGSLAYDGLELQTVPVEVSDKDVDEIAEFYRLRFSDLTPVEREIQPNDVATVDLEKLDDPKGIMKEDTFTEVDIDLAKELTVKEFKDQLPGMKAGDEKRIEVVYADDYPDARFAGARITYQCRVKAVKQRILPPFDDDLARRSGQAETALELRLKIRDELTREREEAQKDGYRRQIIGQFCRKNQVPIPKALVNEYMDAAIKDARQRFPDLNEEEFRKNYRETGTNSIRWNILFHRLAEQESIEVLQAETETWIKRFAEANRVTAEQAREALSSSERASNLRESILEQKTLDFLMDKAKKVPAPAKVDPA
jgi:trigger factor